MNAENHNPQTRTRSLEAIKGSLAALSLVERQAIAMASPVADRLLDDLPGLVDLLESYRDRFGGLALANVQRNPAPISKAVGTLPTCDCGSGWQKIVPPDHACRASERAE